MQHILFIGADFEQYLRLKTLLSDFNCVYSVNLPDGIRQFNQQRFSLIVLDLSLVLSDADQEEVLRSFRRAHPVPIIALYDNVEDSNVIRLLGAGADQVLAIQTTDTVLTAYMQTLVNRYINLDRMDREQNCRTELCVGDFKIDLMRRQVFLKGEKIELSGAVSPGWSSARNSATTPPRWMRTSCTGPSWRPSTASTKPGRRSRRSSWTSPALSSRDRSAAGLIPLPCASGWRL